MNFASIFRKCVSIFEQIATKSAKNLNYVSIMKHVATAGRSQHAAFAMQTQQVATWRSQHVDNIGENVRYPTTNKND